MIDEKHFPVCERIEAYNISPALSKEIMKLEEKMQKLIEKKDISSSDMFRLMTTTSLLKAHYYALSSVQDRVIKAITHRFTQDELNEYVEAHKKDAEKYECKCKLFKDTRDEKN